VWSGGVLRAGSGTGVLVSVRLVLFSAVVLLIAACGSPVSEGTETSAEDLLERSFVSTSVQVEGEPRDLVSEPLAVRFTDASGEVVVAWEAGCNIVGGVFEVTADRLEPHRSPDGVPAFGASEIGCEPHEHEQDAWLEDVFADGLRWTLDGNTLRLTTDSVEFVLREGVWRRGS
jgi:heat shock protein HslJ